MKEVAMDKRGFWVVSSVITYALELESRGGLSLSTVENKVKLQLGKGIVQTCRFSSSGEGAIIEITVLASTSDAQLKSFFKNVLEYLKKHNTFPESVDSVLKASKLGR